MNTNKRNNFADSYDSASLAYYSSSRCVQCDFRNFPALEVCPRCLSCEVERLPLSQRGVLYSYTTLGAQDARQYVGYVDLPEAIRVFAGLAAVDASSPPVCDMPVVLLAVEPPGRGPQFVFAPDRGAKA